MEAVGLEGGDGGLVQAVDGIGRRSEAVEVAGGAIGDLVEDQRSATGQRESGRFGDREHDRRDADLEIRQGHAGAQG